MITDRRMTVAELSMNEVSFSYENCRPVLDQISFHAAPGEAIGLIGANGAGKSTLLRLLVGLNLNFSGEIRVGDTILEEKTLSEVRKRIGYVFQDSDSQLFMTTVAEDVAFAPRNYGLPKEEVEERVIRALEQVHITSLREKSVYKLSGGEKKLASIATILSIDPEIILLDEPSVALDPKNRRNLIRVLNDLQGTKIIASHDLDFIWDTCGRTLLIKEGKIVFDGATEAVMRNRELLEENGLELPLSLYQEKREKRWEET